MSKPNSHVRPNRRVLAAVAILVSVVASSCTGTSGGSDTTALAPPKPDTTAASGPATSDDRAVGSFVGRTDDAQTLVGLVSDGANLLAYVCDGTGVSAWFRGPVQAGGATLKNAAGASLRVVIAADGANGGLTLPGGEMLGFRAEPATGKGGLFRRDRTRNGVRELDGWVVLNDGTTKGLKETALAPAVVTGVGVGTIGGGGLTPLTTLPAPSSTTTTTSPTTSTTTAPPTAVVPTQPGGSPTQPVLSNPGLPSLELRIVPRDDLLAPPTANGDLRFVIAAMGDSFAAGEGAPDANGSYTKSDLRQCRDEANAFPAYTEADFAALGAIASVPARLLAVAGATTTAVTDLRGLTTAVNQAQQALTLAQTSAARAQAALDAANLAVQRFLAGQIAGSLDALRRAVTTAAAALGTANAAIDRAATAFTTAKTDLVAKATTVSAGVAAILTPAIRTSAGFVNTGRSGPFALLGIFAPQLSAELRFATFWVPYTACNQRPPVRVNGQREVWRSAFTQSHPGDPAQTSVVDTDATRCHRSMNAPAALAAQQLAVDLPDVNVVFKSVACSGAHTKHIDAEGYNGVEFTPAQFQAQGQLPPQIDQLAAWASANGISDVDSLYLGIGGNDAGFGIIILACILPYLDFAGIGCDSLADSILQTGTSGTEGLAFMVSHYASIARKLASLDPLAGVRPGNTAGATIGTTTLTPVQLAALLQSRLGAPAGSAGLRFENLHAPSLPDPSRNQNRQPCTGQVPLSANDRDITDRLFGPEGTFAAQSIVPRLNSTIVDAATKAGFEVIAGLTETFGPHGFCSSDPWLNNNNRATATQNALIGKVEFTGYPTQSDLQAMLPAGAQIVTGPPPASQTAGDGFGDFRAASIGGAILPFAGIHLSFGIIHPNVNGYRLGYLPPTLAAIREDARQRFTPPAPDQLRADATATGVVLRWHDRADNERSYRVRAAANGAACGLVTARSLPANAQTVSLTVADNVICDYRVSACGVALAGRPLCSDEVAVRFTTVLPAAPAGFSVTLSPAPVKAQARWNAVTDARQYALTLRPATGVAVQAVTDRTDAVLPEGTAVLAPGTYQATVRSCAARCGTESAPVTLTVVGSTSTSSSSTSSSTLSPSSSTSSSTLSPSSSTTTIVSATSSTTGVSSTTLVSNSVVSTTALPATAAPGSTAAPAPTTPTAPAASTTSPIAVAPTSTPTVTPTTVGPAPTVSPSTFATSTTPTTLAPSTSAAPTAPLTVPATKADPTLPPSTKA